MGESAGPPPTGAPPNGVRRLLALWTLVIRRDRRRRGKPSGIRVRGSAFSVIVMDMFFPVAIDTSAGLCPLDAIVAALAALAGARS